MCVCVCACVCVCVCVCVCDGRVVRESEFRGAWSGDQSFETHRSAGVLTGVLTSDVFQQVVVQTKKFLYWSMLE